MREFAEIWADTDKVVYSRTLEAVATRDLSIGGPTLAAHALRDGLLDERRFDSGVVFLRLQVAN